MRGFINFGRGYSFFSCGFIFWSSGFICVDIQIYESGTNYFAFLVGIHFSVSRIHFISTCPQRKQMDPAQKLRNTVHEMRYLRSHSFDVVADSLHVTSDSFSMTTDTFRFANRRQNK
jgi:hypothetical protein